MSEAKEVDVFGQLDQAGKFIAAEIKTARKYEAAAKEKAGVDLEKANNHWIAATQRLAEARKLCAEAKISFKEFKEKWAPDISRATLYRVIAIGSGKLTIEEQRKEWREEKQAAKEKKESQKKESQKKESSETEAKPKLSGQATAEKEQVDAVIAKLPASWETPPEKAEQEPPAPSPEEASALSQFEEGVELLRKIVTHPAAKFAVTYISSADLASVADFLKQVAEKKTRKAA
jgi:hypothetical protein